MFRLSRVAPLGCIVVLAAAFSLNAVPLHAAEAAPGPVQAPAVQSASIGTAATDARAFLDRYCVACHNERLRTAGLLLDAADVAHVGAGAETWEKVVGKLRSGAMPPPGRRRPESAALDAFATWLETELDREAAAHPNPGRVADHRLNRFEYGNAIRDLLALEIDAAELLPADESDQGFDNIAEVLSMSPTLLGRYMFAARRISQLAVGDPANRAGRRDVRPVARLAAGRSHERGPAVRYARRRAHAPLLSARRRLRRADPARAELHQLAYSGHQHAGGDRRPARRGARLPDDDRR